MYLQEGENNRWNKLVLDSLIVIAGHLARLAQVEQLSSSLQDLESEDKVTGFLHRRFASEAMQKELLRVHHFGDEASLIMIDLDLGKGRSPDVYGTLLGESVLKAVASTIVANTRKIDMYGRLGLDEFMILCPRLSRRESEQVAEYLVKRINESLMNLTQRRGSADVRGDVNIAVPTTASVGIAHLKKGDSFDSLFASAQSALNAAQVSGGNVAKVSDTEVE